MTAVLEQPGSLGRIIRDDSGGVKAIVEYKDCTEEQAAIREINTGTYIFDNRKLFAALAKVTNENAQQEYYLTDVIRIMCEDGRSSKGPQWKILRKLSASMTGQRWRKLSDSCASASINVICWKA